MTTESQNPDLGALSPQDLAARTAKAIASFTDRPADMVGDIAVIYEAARRYAQQAGVRHRLVVISPDDDTDYCFLDVSREEALKKFEESADGQLYDQSKKPLKVQESEFAGSFMLWRNMRGNMADMLGQRGMPQDLLDLLRGPLK